MNPAEFTAAIRKAKKAPAYFLRGPERYLHEVCREAVVKAVPAEAREWCLVEVEFEPGGLAREVEGANQMPMLGGHRYFYFSDPEDFEHASDDDTRALEAYLDRPSPFTTVVFAALEPDRRRRFIQLLEKKTQVVDIRPMTRHEAAAWAREFLEQAGVELDPELAEEIAAKFERAYDREPERSGINLLWMRTELEKTLTARPGAKRLERQDLELIVAFREDHEISAFLRALAERRSPEALERLHTLLASKTAETLLLWCIADLIRQALKLQGAAGPRGIPAARGPSGGWGRSRGAFYSSPNATLALEHYSRLELLRALRLVRQTDLGIKSSWKDSRTLLEFLVWQITVGQGARSAGEAFESLPAWTEDATAPSDR